MKNDDRVHRDEMNVLQKAHRFDQEALAWIYQTYHTTVYRYIYHHLSDAQTTQDLASEVFRRFLQALRDGGGPSRQLRAWLYRVAHNLIVDELRRRAHRDHASLDEAPAEMLGDPGRSPEELAGSAVTSARVREALLLLTPEQRQVIVLKFLEGLSNAEVAAITGKTISAIKALQHRGLGTLRQRLGAGRTVSIMAKGEQAEAFSA
jgi:RNA polymerase sigma-70 factor (ECF subfamily)